MKKQLLGAGVGLMSLALVACGGGSSPSSEGSASGGSADGKKLTVWIMEGTNADATAYFDKIKSDFKAKTGADVDVQFVPWTAAHDKFTNAIAGGTTPDVAELGFTYTPEFAEAGALADLTDKMAAAGLDKGMIQAATDAGTYEGKVYGAPWYAGVRAFLYNKDIFAKAGIAKPPATWAELQDAVTKIKKTQPDVVPFPVLGASEFTVYPWIWGAGGEIATQDGDKYTAAINSAQAQEGLSFYTDLALKHNSSTAAAATWNEKDALTNFQQGKVGMVMNGSWTPAAIQKNAPDFYSKVGAFPIPGKTSGLSATAVGGSHLSVFEKSENKDLAWQFVQMMVTGDASKKWATETHFFPCDQAGVDSLVASTDPLVAPFAKQMKEAGKTVPAVPAFAKIQANKTVVNMMNSILTGKADVKTATEKANGEMSQVFGG